MGVHFVNGPLVGDGVLDVTQPELLVYEPLPNGRLRLVAVDYLVLSEAWHASNTRASRAQGAALSLVRKPQSLRTAGVLHPACLGMEVEPAGLFANWNPRVSCDVFTRQE